MRDLRADNVIRLRDGRLLGYGEFGDPAGKPLFFFHGFPGSRLEAQLGRDAAARKGVRIVAPDRPGMGLSDFKPGRRIADWPDDVVELADALGIERFAVAGVSGGGPYAAVCALRIPDRLTGVGIISGVGPFDVPGAAAQMNRMNQLLFGLARRAPSLAAVPIWLEGLVVRRFPERAMQLMERALPECDRAILARPEVHSLMIADVTEAFRSGSRGAVWELGLYSRAWGFRLEDITVPVHLWQGDADTNVPVAMGRYQASVIPTCHATFYPGEGHFLVVDRIEEMLDALFAERAETNGSPASAE